MNAPPKKLKMFEVATYLADNKGFTISTMTAHNWAKTGVKGITLRTALVPRRPNGRPDTRITTTAWLEDFLAAIGKSISSMKS